MAEPKENGFVSQIDIETSNMNLSAEKKGTVDDQKDMFRMGKAQELRVSIVVAAACDLGLMLAAKLPLRLHLWLLHDFDGQLGNHARVSKRRSGRLRHHRLTIMQHIHYRPHQRRYCRHDLVVSRCMGWFPGREYLHG